MFGTFNLYQVSLKTTENVKTKKDEERMKKLFENCFYLSDCL